MLADSKIMYFGILSETMENAGGFQNNVFWNFKRNPACRQAGMCFDAAGSH
jgi:hypothetical protein